MMSSSLSGCGLPLSMLPTKDEVDHTRPVGTEKTDLAFAAAAAVIDIYWRDCILSGEVQRWESLRAAGSTPLHATTGAAFLFRGGG